MTLDHIAHIIEILVFLGGLYKVMRRVDRFLAIFEDYPPHRHVNGSRIIYPKGYEPPRIDSAQPTQG